VVSPPCETAALTPPLYVISLDRRLGLIVLLTIMQNMTKNISNFM